MTGAYLQMAAALAFVILLIVATGYLMRKKQGRGGMMTVVGYQAFGPKKGVAALRIGEEILILGMTVNDMRLLKVFKAEDLDLPAVDVFQNRLQKFIKKETGSK